MGYKKIPNLRKSSLMLEIFKEVYATEKIHGTSTHIAYKNGELKFFPGCIKYDLFASLFDHDQLLEKFEAINSPEIIIFGEGYGGKCQRMAHVYGPDTRFVAFEVKIGNHWLNVEKAHKVVEEFGLEFVHWVKGPATLDFVNYWRDQPSEQAKRNGMGDNHIREGIVIRAPVEVTLNDGKRLLAKHKRPEFEETKSARSDKPIDPEKKLRMAKASEIAEEYVVPMRLDHVLDKYVAFHRTTNPDFEPSIENTGQVISAMIKDVKTEEGDEIEWTKEVDKAISRKTALLYKQYLRDN